MTLAVDPDKKGTSYQDNTSCQSARSRCCVLQSWVTGQVAQADRSGILGALALAQQALKA